MQTIRYTLIAFFLLAAGIMPATADSISGIRIDQPSPSYLAFDQRVQISFDYSTEEAGGVRIFVLPFTAGAPSPAYGVNPSPLYPAGNGSGTAFLTLTSGETVVDQIRFQMVNADQSKIIMEFFVDVAFHYGPHSISNIVLDPDAFGSFLHGEDVAATFDYSTTASGGVRIFMRPMSGGALAPGYSAHGSPVYAVGDGAASGSFTIGTGTVVVDQVRFQMMDADQTQVLLEFTVDTEYYFGDHAIRNIVLSPAVPAALPLGSTTDRVEITFDYATSEVGGVRIFPRPYTDGDLTPGYGASGSALLPAGSGSGSGWFTINTGMARVDGVRFRMTNADQTFNLLEFVIPADYFFADNRVSEIDVSHRSPAYLTFGEEISFAFSQTIAHVGGARIFGRPMSGGDLTPGYSAHGSGLYPTGGGSGSGFFTVNGAAAEVDHIRFRMVNDDQTLLLSDYHLPVEYHFIAPFSNVSSESEDGLPAEYALGQNYPNPFNPVTTIPFALPQAGQVRLAVYDMLGREVRTLVDGPMAGGAHQVAFEAGELPSGMYIYRLHAPGMALTRTLALIK